MRRSKTSEHIDVPSTILWYSAEITISDVVHGDNVTMDTKLVEDKDKTGTGKVAKTRTTNKN